MQVDKLKNLKIHIFIIRSYHRGHIACLSCLSQPFHLQEELQQIASWLSEEGLSPDSSKDTQLCLLWRFLQSTRNRLSSVTQDLDTQRSQHLSEMAEVRYQPPNYHWY